MIYLGLGMAIMAVVTWVFAQSEIVRQGRIDLMANKFAANHVLDNLEIKRSLLAGEFDLDSWERVEVLEALNKALEWQKKQTK